MVYVTFKYHENKLEGMHIKEWSNSIAKSISFFPTVQFAISVHMFQFPFTMLFCESK